MVSGPLLILKGELVRQESNKFIDNRHPRTAIGVKNDGGLIAADVDRRFSEAQGVTVEEMPKIMGFRL